MNAETVHDLADEAIIKFVYRDQARGNKCGCGGCVTDVEDRYEWLHSVGAWAHQQRLELNHKAFVKDDEGDWAEDFGDAQGA